MIKIISSIAIFLCIALLQSTYGQTNEEIALAKAREAVKLMDEGNVDRSIKLLEEAQKLVPDGYAYQYEMAYAYYLKKDYKKAIKILEKNMNHKDVSERLFQLLGNSYDIIGKSEKAFEAYDAGLKIFPNSGIIYLEKGNVHWGKKEYGKALPYYEKGIEVDPEFPSNYYRAARIYCSSTEEVWGMIYGEIFMNLERNTKRTEEISKLLYNTYKKEIKFTGKNSMTVSFCQQMTLDINDILDSTKFKLPFCMIYEPTLLLAIAAEESIDINSLDRIRKNFVENYFKMERNKTHPNILFEYQNEVLNAGHLEAYNHWILMKGEEDSFEIWHSNNKEKWDDFIKWFTDNGLKVDNVNKFYRGQY